MNLNPIKDYEGLYSLDLNTNRVYNIKFNRILSNSVRNKYNCVKLYKNGKYKIFQLHRLVYEAHYGEIPEGMLIDHIDNNKTNNNIDNLRLATLSENMCNRKIHKNNKIGYKNIILTKFNTYLVQIIKNKKTVYCITFKSLEEAIKNRDIQLELYHKNFMNIG